MNKLVILTILSLLRVISGFSTTPSRRAVTGFVVKSSRKLFLVKGDQESDFPPEENSDDFSGKVDWDAEWKKVVASEGGIADGVERPGKDFYKSEAEIAAIKATNKAAFKVAETSADIKSSMPDIRSLSGDWKFWIAILAIVSIGISLLSAPMAATNIPAGGSDGSYYI